MTLLSYWQPLGTCRQGVMPELGEAASGARVIAFDRPPFGLSERPLTWQGSEEDNPYTSQVGRHCLQVMPLSVCLLCKAAKLLPVTHGARHASMKQASGRALIALCLSMSVHC